MPLSKNGEQEEQHDSGTKARTTVNHRFPVGLSTWWNMMFDILSLCFLLR